MIRDPLVIALIGCAAGCIAALIMYRIGIVVGREEARREFVLGRKSS